MFGLNTLKQWLYETPNTETTSDVDSEKAGSTDSDKETDNDKITVETLTIGTEEQND